MIIVIPAVSTEFLSDVSIPANCAKKASEPKSNSGKSGLGKLLTVSGEDRVFTSRK